MVNEVVKKCHFVAKMMVGRKGYDMISVGRFEVYLKFYEVVFSGITQIKRINFIIKFSL